MSLDLWLIDAFTDHPFAGNPAGVCLLAAPRPDEWMQALAREMNQAET
ncbi:MAG: PhzF family phenazine biosynthesis protein, partial [Gemmatimonadetes bacterium]